MKDAAPELEQPRWDGVWLVCKDCGKRSSGPKDVKAKELVSTLRSATKRDAPRPRVVTTSCLGLCPKAATAVAVVSPTLGTRIVAIKSRKKLEAALAAVADVPRG